MVSMGPLIAATLGIALIVVGAGINFLISGAEVPEGTDFCAESGLTFEDFRAAMERANTDKRVLLFVQSGKCWGPEQLEFLSEEEKKNIICREMFEEDPPDSKVLHFIRTECDDFVVIPEEPRDVDITWYELKDVTFMTDWDGESRGPAGWNLTAVVVVENPFDVEVRYQLLIGKIDEWDVALDYKIRGSETRDRYLIVPAKREVHVPVSITSPKFRHSSSADTLDPRNPDLIFGELRLVNFYGNGAEQGSTRFAFSDVEWQGDIIENCERFGGQCGECTEGYSMFAEDCDDICCLPPREEALCRPLEGSDDCEWSQPEKCVVKQEDCKFVLRSES